MSSFDYDENDHDRIAPQEEEEIIDAFLGEHPRARELHLMRAALEQRRATFRHERDRARDDRERQRLSAKIAELNTQIAAIEQEEAITTFVENSVRITLHKPAHEDLEP